MNAKKKGVGLIPYGQMYYIDHLAVICALMDIPLLLISENDYEIAKKCYPGLDVQLLDDQVLTPEYLIANYDVLFMSDVWNRHDFHAQYASLEKQYNKHLRHVFCPHGFSDKAFYFRCTANEDIALVYGQNMLDLLKSEGVFEDLYVYILVGNYRYTYFKQNRVFYDELMQREVLNHFDKPRPTILYAPTWQDFEESSTFFDAASDLLQRLPSDYNMIVKPHPRLELDNAPEYYRIMGRFENKGNIVFLKDFSLIFPLLAHSDIYIGDMSAVGYDYLTFNKPMYFLNKNMRDSKVDRGLFLYRCGIEVPPDQFSNIYEIISKTISDDQERFSKIRSEVYQYTFGQERAFADIKQWIVDAYTQTPAPV